MLRRGKACCYGLVLATEIVDFDEERPCAVFSRCAHRQTSLYSAILLDVLVSIVERLHVGIRLALLNKRYESVKLILADFTCVVAHERTHLLNLSLISRLYVLQIDALALRLVESDDKHRSNLVDWLFWHSYVKSVNSVSETNVAMTEQSDALHLSAVVLRRQTERLDSHALSRRIAEGCGKDCVVALNEADIFCRVVIALVESLRVDRDYSLSKRSFAEGLPRTSAVDAHRVHVHPCLYVVEDSNFLVVDSSVSAYWHTEKHITVLAHHVDEHAYDLLRTLVAVALVHAPLVVP